MGYTEFDRKCDDAALGCSFSRRTRLLVWFMKHTWPLWRRSDRAKAYFAAALAKTLRAPRKSFEGQLQELVGTDADIHVSLHTSDPTVGDPDTEVSHADYARQKLDCALQKLDDNGW